MCVVSSTTGMVSPYIVQYNYQGHILFFLEAFDCDNDTFGQGVVDIFRDGCSPSGNVDQRLQRGGTVAE